MLLLYQIIEFESIPKTHIRNFPSSGIWIIISNPSSTIISEVSEVISKKDFDQLGFLLNLGSKSFIKVHENSIENKIKLFNSYQEIPVLTGVSYGSKIIAKCIFILTEQGYMIIFILYHVGNLSAKDFRISQYFKYGFVNLLNSLILTEELILTEP